MQRAGMEARDDNAIAAQGQRTCLSPCALQAIALLIFLMAQYLFASGAHAYNGQGVQGQFEVAASPSSGKGTAWKAQEGFFVKADE